MLQRLSILPCHLAGNPGKVAVLVHCQLPPQVVVGMLAWSAGLGFKVRSEAFPIASEVIRKLWMRSTGNPIVLDYIDTDSRVHSSESTPLWG